MSSSFLPESVKQTLEEHEARIDELENKNENLWNVAAELERERYELRAENRRLRQGILTAIDTLDKMDAYDTPLYEHLDELIGEGE